MPLFGALLSQQACSSFSGQRLGDVLRQGVVVCPHAPTCGIRHSAGGGAAIQSCKGFNLAMHRHNTPPTSFTPDQVLRAVKGWCWDCGEQVPEYMVQNEVWKAAWPGGFGEKKLKRLKVAATKDFGERERSIHSGLVHVHLNLCFGCLELRLGRHLTIKDFIAVTRKGKPMSYNAGVFLGYLLGYRAAKREAQKVAEDGDKKDEGG